MGRTQAPARPRDRKYAACSSEDDPIPLPGEHARGKPLREQAGDGAAATVDPAVNPADRPGAVGEDPGPGASLEALLTENDRTPL